MPTTVASNDVERLSDIQDSEEFAEIKQLMWDLENMNGQGVVGHSEASAAAEAAAIEASLKALDDLASTLIEEQAADTESDGSVENDSVPNAALPVGADSNRCLLHEASLLLGEWLANDTDTTLDRRQMIDEAHSLLHLASDVPGLEGSERGHTYNDRRRPPVG